MNGWGVLPGKVAAYQGHVIPVGNSSDTMTECNSYGIMEIDVVADNIGRLFRILFIYFTNINVFCDFVSVFATNGAMGGRTGLLELGRRGSERKG